VNAQPSVQPACEVCGSEATHYKDRRPLCDRDSCLSRTQGTRDKEQGTRNSSAEGGGRGLYVVGSPCVQGESRCEPELTGLIRDYDRGKLQPAAVALGELPANASRAMRDVADDIRLLLGLRLAVDEPRPLPYSTRFCAGRCGLYDQAHASRVLRQLERAGVIVSAEALAPRGQPYGTKTYRAP
jgi:hypothetical protein